MPERHTESNIANVLKEAICEWGIPPKAPQVTNNAANMYAAATEAECFPHIGCLAHTLNLAAQKALKVNTVSRILARIRRIVSFFHRSTTAATELKQKILLLGIRNGNNRKLIMDVCTRWNSAADMLERFLELQPAVYAALCSKDIKYKERDISTLSESDVQLAEEIMECLIPLREITKAICTEKMPTVSIILPLLEKLRRFVTVKENDQPVLKQMKQAMAQNLSTS
ncbi:E3 SUMO-protein ligase ZBED1-like [Argopecten irradians]|uniref:E3 SUMO-protein ligase ZBED1-like n=1 Tax=Argopecten irradians TaxID=31199 RepID=UPI00371731E0